MQNPFETGHIRNYILLYVSVVVIMILFFLAGTLYYDVEKIDKKIFDTVNKDVETVSHQEKKEKSFTKFKLLEKAY